MAENAAARARLKAVVDRLTDADLARPMSAAWTRTIAPTQVRHAMVAEAEAVGRTAETLPTPLIEAILEARPRSLTRATHRRQYLDQIARTLGS